jgi:large subunit ribosomal protein L7/L12
MVLKRLPQQAAALHRAYSEVAAPKIVHEIAGRPLSPQVQSIASQVLSLTLLDTVSLVQELKKQLNISDASLGPAFPAGGANAAPSPQGAASAAEPEKSEFRVILEKFDAPGKAKIIRELKALLPSLNLVEAKNFVEGAPKVIKEKVPRAEAEKLKKTFEEHGATIKLE